MRWVDPTPVQVWVVLCDEATIGCRIERRRLVEEVISLAMPRSRPSNVSWATSVDTLAVAASCGTMVGVDIERPVARRAGARYLAALAASSLSPREALVYGRVDAAERAEWLLRRWTAKEAHLKRVGTGLCTAPGSIDIHWPSASREPAVARCVTTQNGTCSYLRSFTDARAAFICHLACERPLSDREVEFRCVYKPEMGA